MTNQHKPCSSFACSRTDVRAIIALAGLYLGGFALLWSPSDAAGLVVAAALAPPLIWLSLRDLRSYEIPESATLAVAVIALCQLWLTAPEAMLAHLGAGAGLAALIWAMGELYYRKTGHEGLGIGDAKLFGAGALLLGPGQIADLILLSCAGGMVLHGVMRARAQATEHGIPFGPFIAYAIFMLSFLDPFFL